MTTLRGPVPVPPAPEHRFPLIATLAPILMSVVLWAVTGSAIVLLFAALGPVVAIGGLADGRLGARRGARRESSRFEAGVDALRRAITEAHDREREDLDRAHPTARSVLARGDHDPDRWGGHIDSLTVTLGRGRVASALRVEQSDDERVRSLAETAESLDDAPVAVPALSGVVVVGDTVRSSAVARSLVMQLAARLSPAVHELRVHPALLDTWNAMPHPVVPDPTLPPGAVRFQHRSSGLCATIAASAALGGAPSSARLVVELGGSPAIARSDDRAVLGPIAPDYLSAASARAGAERLAELARRDRVVGDAALVPDRVAWSEVERGAAGRDDLRAVLGVGAEGCVSVDLVSQGPHAVVGGMTGSGKSELLVAWALGLAASHAPAELSLLLVDFKGGASFAPLTPLPHVVGVISDLDDALAQRALDSLSAEVRRRERRLAEAGARSIAELPPDSGLARLVVIVDEFAAMVSEHPALHALFGDLAARGRSLGIHLVLCTQRPSGAVRDGVLANVGIRMSLRVNNAADSAAVVGTDAAVSLDPRTPGRAWMCVDGDEPVLVQVPLARSEDVDAVAASWVVAPRADRPWLEPLGAHVPLRSLPPGPGIPLGVIDDPAAQSQPVLDWEPRGEGPLLVLGGPRSGRTTVLDVVAAAVPGTRVVEGDPEAAWDAVQHPGDHALLLDDLDLILARMPADHVTAFLDALALRLREAPARGRVVAVTAQRLTPALAGVAPACPARLLLRLPSRQEHVVAGGAGEHWTGHAPAGRGRWGRWLVQVAEPDGVAPRAEASVRTLSLADAALAIVTSRPGLFVDAARAANRVAVSLEGSAAEATAILAAPPALLVGDPDAWQAAWGSLAALAGQRAVLFDRCGVAEFRALLRTRELPPPITERLGAAVLRSPDGTCERVTLER